MSKYPIVLDYKLHLMLHKEWKRKTTPENAVKNINTLMDKDVISEIDAEESYSYFDQCGTDVFKKGFSMHISSNQYGKESNLLDSLLFVNDDEYMSKEFLTKDGRFFVFPYYCRELNKSFVTIYDLVRDKKQKCLISFCAFLSKFIIVGDYLFSLRHIPTTNLYKIYTLKICYGDLKVKELETIDINNNFSYPKIIADQSDSQIKNQKFIIICAENQFMSGQILQNDEIVLSGISELERTVNFLGQYRLVADLLQGFFYNNRLNSFKFYEINLKTTESKETSMTIELDTNGLVINNYHTNPYCWTKNRFYGMFRLENYHCQLLMFDTLTSKWNDVKIVASAPQYMFVDEDEFLTFSTGVYGGSGALYQVALRKPNTLMNLTWFAALRESSTYGNVKYMNVVRQIQI